MTTPATQEIETGALTPTGFERWVDRVARCLAGTHPDWNPDGDQERDGYSLDWLYDQYRDGKTPLQMMPIILWRMNGLHRAVPGESP